MPPTAAILSLGLGHSPWGVSGGRPGPDEPTPIPWTQTESVPRKIIDQSRHAIAA
jgi:hypothetical protein